MKLGGYNNKGAERLNTMFNKLLNVKALFVLMALASLILTASAHFKLG